MIFCRHQINTRWTNKATLALFSLLLSFLITLSHATAQEIPFYWNHIDIKIDVQTNGDMLVTEDQEYVFNTEYTNQRYRYIPLDRVDEIKVVVQNVTNFNSNEYIKL